jgi:hypothetical protein
MISNILATILRCDDCCLLRKITYTSGIKEWAAESEKAAAETGIHAGPVLRSVSEAMPTSAGAQPRGPLDLLKGGSRGTGYQENFARTADGPVTGQGDGGPHAERRVWTR